LAHDTVATRSGLLSIVVVPNACVIVTGNASPDAVAPMLLENLAAQFGLSLTAGPPPVIPSAE